MLLRLIEHAIDLVDDAGMPDIGLYDTSSEFIPPGTIRLPEHYGHAWLSLLFVPGREHSSKCHLVDLQISLSKKTHGQLNYEGLDFLEQLRWRSAAVCGWHCGEPLGILKMNTRRQMNSMDG